MSLPDPSCLVPDEASEFIRQNFRTTIRGSAVVIACIACVYATALWRVGDPHWWHHGVIALLAPSERALGPLTTAVARSGWRWLRRAAAGPRAAAIRTPRSG